MSAFITDNFTGTAGTALSAHMPDVGGAWTPHPAFSGDTIQLSGTGTIHGTAGSTACAYYNATAPGNADQYVEAVFLFKSDTPTNYMAVHARMSTSDFSSYALQYDGTEHKLVLERWNAGVNTELTNYAISTTIGTSITGRLTVTGSGATVTLLVTIGGVDQTPISDTSGSRITTTGHIGVQSYDQATHITGLHLDSVSADVTGGGGGGGDTITVAINDADIFLSPYNWRVNDSYAQTTNPGAYLTVGFSGTSIGVNVDGSPLSGASIASGNWPKIIAWVDSAPSATIQITDGLVQIATGLASGSHVLHLALKSTIQSADRWTTPVNVLRLTGITIDSTASLSAPTLQPRRTLIYGDSITEGVYVLGAVSDMASNDSSQDYAVSLSNALGSEYGAVGFGGQGWTVSGGGNVVPLYTPGNATSSAWDKYSAGQSRLVSGLLTPAPDYIFILHGTNDTLQSASDADVTASVTAFLGAIRSVAPSAKIFLCIPFGGYKRSAITSGFGAVTDASAHLIDLGISAQSGVSGGGIETVYANDGLHPKPLGHARFASLLTQAAQSDLGGSGGGGINGSAILGML